MITFEIVTPEGLKLAEDAYEILVPTPDGEIGILPHHIPLITLVQAGVVSIRRHRDDTEFEHLATSGGLVEIDGQRVRLLADTAERADDIDELRAKQALELAREVQKTASDHVAIADATRLIERNLARLRVTDLRRRKHRG